jgi:hypothetical protein
MNKEKENNNNASKGHQKLQAVLNLKEVADRIANVTQLVLSEESVQTMRNNGVSKCKRQACLGDLKRTVIPFFKSASTKVQDAANNLSPIASTEYVHQHTRLIINVKTFLWVCPPKPGSEALHKSSPLAPIKNVLHSKPIKK